MRQRKKPHVEISKKFQRMFYQFLKNVEPIPVARFLAISLLDDDHWKTRFFGWGKWCHEKLIMSSIQ